MWYSSASESVVRFWFSCLEFKLRFSVETICSLLAKDSGKPTEARSYVRNITLMVWAWFLKRRKKTFFSTSRSRAGPEYNFEREDTYIWNLFPSLLYLPLLSSWCCSHPCKPTQTCSTSPFHQIPISAVLLISARCLQESSLSQFTQKYK